MKRIIMVTGLAVAVAGGVRGATLNAGQVPASAKWVLHLDVEGLKNTQVGRILMQRLTTGQENNKMNALAAILGSDLRADLAGVTLSGASDAEDENVVMLSGRFNKQQLELFVKANEAYRGEEYRGATLHSWIDEKKKKRMFGAILGGGERILMSGSAASVKAVLDVMAGQGASLAQDNAGGLSLQAANNSVLVGAADLTRLNRSKTNAQTLKQASSATVSLSEQGADMVGRITLVADTAENARHLNDAARGILAMIQLDEKTEQATKDSLRATTVDLEDKTLRVTIHMPAQVLVDSIQKKWQEEDAKKKAEAAAAAAGTAQK